MSDTLEAALSYARLGMAVYAPGAGSKLPSRGSKGKPGLTSATATADADLLRGIYCEAPARNVAIRLDACEPALVAIDLDTQAAHPHEPADPDGTDALHDWCEARGVELPDTWQVRTASGGTHLIFSLPEGAKVPPSRSNLLPHVDALGRGHGELLPPSRISGRPDPYAWVRPPWASPIAELPRELLSLWEQAAPEGKGKGRNEALTSRAGTLWGTSAQDEGQLVAQVIAYNAAQPDPLPTSEAAKVARSISKTEKNRRTPTQGEIVAFMMTDPELRGFGTNVLDGGLYVTGPLPWSMLGERRRWQDADGEHLFCYVSARTGSNSRRNIAGALTIVAAERRFNPIADTLDHLPAWDGTPRADHVLWVLLGCEDTPYVRAVSHTFMRGAVLRGYQPGCKFDLVLTLIGPQGCGKSLSCRRLAMRDELFCEGVANLEDVKGTAEKLLGKWIVELGELEGMTGRRATAVKAALSAQSVTVRLPYEKSARDLPRSCAFVATTNEGRFLADPTGARRFLPVRCAVADREGWEGATERQIEAFVMQAWSEVRDEYKSALALPPERFAEAFPVVLDRDMEAAAEEARECATIEDTDVGVVNEWLGRAVAREGVTRVCAREVAEKALGIDPARSGSRRAIADVARILDTRCPGWHYAGKQRVAGYGVCRAWDYGGGA